jgi:hypothetical protein
MLDTPCSELKSRQCCSVPFSFYLKKRLDFLQTLTADFVLRVTLTNPPQFGFFISVMNYLGVGVFRSCTRCISVMKNVGCFKRDLAAQKIPPSEADWPRQRVSMPLF